MAMSEARLLPRTEGSGRSVLVLAASCAPRSRGLQWRPLPAAYRHLDALVCFALTVLGMRVDSWLFFLGRFGGDKAAICSGLLFVRILHLRNRAKRK